MTTKDTLRIVFMGTPEFAVPSLQALINSQYSVVAVYSQPPRPAGRGHQVQKSPVQQAAEAANIAVYTPQTLKTPEAQAEFAALKPDLAIVAAYGLILPKAVLATPCLGCVNVHASLLPRWRGASPIQHAIWYGDAETGVTLMQMEAGLDTGPMLHVVKCPITPTTTAASLHDELAKLGANALPNLVDALATGHGPTPHPQPEQGVTYARLLTKNDGVVNWAKPAVEIDRQIRAFTPWPSCRSGKLKIVAAENTSSTSAAQAGTLLDKEGHVACGAGSVLKLTRLQPDGAKAMDVSAALNGGYISIGQIVA